MDNSVREVDNLVCVLDNLAREADNLVSPCSRLDKCPHRAIFVH